MFFCRYTGYAGSLAWEYWVTGCSYGSINHDADVCACLPANNDKMFLEVSGYNCTSYGIGEWLYKGVDPTIADDLIDDAWTPDSPAR